MPTHEPSEDAFGFGSVGPSAKDRLRQIRPAASADSPADLARIDAVAENAGFVSREAPAAEYVYRSTRQARPEPRNALNMRVSGEPWQCLPKVLRGEPLQLSGRFGRDHEASWAAFEIASPLALESNFQKTYSSSTAQEVQP